ncbi:N-acetylmuramoyl-L-alanine amidase LytC precursor [Mobiluncus mulieris]|nr:N-acetylmuramoyl-L-alanine amidase LytC precursor [Mobiluncus mulieris]
MNRFSKKLLVGVGSAALITGMGSIPAVAGDLPYERLAGPSGVETSLAVAKHTWGDTWKVVYVASNRNPVDALPAATIGDGPVVLTDGNTLNLGGVKPSKIAILGGLGAVPQAIADQAKATGAEVVRLAGADRNATAVEIAKRWVAVNGAPKNVYVTKNVGSGSPDAVAASVLRDGPIVTFTNDASVAALAGTVADLKAEKVTALGGTGVVPDAVVKAAANGKATARLAGSNRYETAFEIAKYAKAQKSGSNVYLASGTALKDAMVAGAAKDGVILLSPANGEGVKSKADVLGAAKLIVTGGTGVMPDSTVTAAATGVIPQPAQAVQPTQPAQPKPQQPEPQKPAPQPKQSAKRTPTKPAQPKPQQPAHPAGKTPVGKECPASAPIKGNQDSMKYHVPGGRFYKRTIPEQCFATESEAQAAGFQKAGA